ncbi:MAG: type II toxin-antitoxin system HicA family toxin [Nostoc sp.]
MKSGLILKLTVTRTIPNHSGDMPEGTLRAILKQAGIEPEDFPNSS